MIVSHELRKTFGKVEAVKAVSFEARDGQITALLGDNGAGKTTTIRMIAGILRPDHGSIAFDGEKDAVARRNLGVLSDAKGLYERQTSRENMRYYARLMGLEDKAIEGNIERAVKLLEIQDLIDRPTKGFSTGQKMKVLLGRLLLPRLAGTRLAAWEPAGPARIVTWGGRHSLLVYLVHQPLFISALTLATLVVPPPSPEEHAFRAECQRSCAGPNLPGPVCRAVCSCTIDGLKREKLWQKALDNLLSPQESVRMTELAQTCLLER